MASCALCSGKSRETVLIFHHVRKAQRVTLEVALCETCGNDLEKHLKRAIPKRLMEVVTIERLAEAYEQDETAREAGSSDGAAAA